MRLPKIVQEGVDNHQQVRSYSLIKIFTSRFNRETPLSKLLQGLVEELTITTTKS